MTNWNELTRMQILEIMLEKHWICPLKFSFSDEYKYAMMKDDINHLIVAGRVNSDGYLCLLKDQDKILLTELNLNWQTYNDVDFNLPENLLHGELQRLQSLQLLKYYDYNYDYNSLNDPAFRYIFRITNIIKLKYVQIQRNNEYQNVVRRRDRNNIIVSYPVASYPLYCSQAIPRIIAANQGLS